MKTCTKCKLDKPLEEFANNASKPDGKHNMCKKCKNRYNKGYYQTTKEIHNPGRAERRIAFRREMQDLLLEYLKKHPCIDCGETDPIVLEFDHRGDKLGNISQFVAWGKPKQVVLDEVAKCDVRCANCHKRKTARDFGWYKALTQ